MKPKLIPYTPSEAAIATGRSVENQRNDRRAGYTPKQEGHARYDLMGLCRLYCIEQFARSGIGPGVSTGFADDVAKALYFISLAHGEVWSPALIASALPEEELEQMKAGMMPGVPARILDDMIEVQRIHRLYSHFASLEEIDEHMLKHIIVWANGQSEIGEEIGERFGQRGLMDPKLGGVVSVMVFASNARLLVSQMPRPIFDIEGP